jgi:hypothetical protein
MIDPKRYGTMTYTSDNVRYVRLCHNTGANTQVALDARGLLVVMNMSIELNMTAAWILGAMTAMVLSGRECNPCNREIDWVD